MSRCHIRNTFPVAAVGFARNAGETAKDLRISHNYSPKHENKKQIDASKKLEKKAIGETSAKVNNEIAKENCKLRETFQIDF